MWPYNKNFGKRKSLWHYIADNDFYFIFATKLNNDDVGVLVYFIYPPPPSLLPIPARYTALVFFFIFFFSLSFLFYLFLFTPVWSNNKNASGESLHSVNIVHVAYSNVRQETIVRSGKVCRLYLHQWSSGGYVEFCFYFFIFFHFSEEFHVFLYLLTVAGNSFRRHSPQSAWLESFIYRC